MFEEVLQNFIIITSIDKKVMLPVKKIIWKNLNKIMKSTLLSHTQIDNKMLINFFSGILNNIKYTYYKNIQYIFWLFNSSS